MVILCSMLNDAPLFLPLHLVTWKYGSAKCVQLSVFSLYLSVCVYTLCLIKVYHPTTSNNNNFWSSALLMCGTVCSIMLLMRPSVSEKSDWQRACMQNYSILNTYCKRILWCKSYGQIKCNYYSRGVPLLLSLWFSGSWSFPRVHTLHRWGQKFTTFRWNIHLVIFAAKTATVKTIDGGWVAFFETQCTCEPKLRRAWLLVMAIHNMKQH